MRKRRSADEIERLISDFKTSGHTVVNYCKKNKVNPGSLYRILSRHRANAALACKSPKPSPQKKLSAFIPVTVLPEAQESKICADDSPKLLFLKSEKWELKIEPGTDVNWISQILRAIQ